MVAPFPSQKYKFFQILIAISPIIKIKNVKNIFFWEKNE
jgi:hypothetical protein